MFGQKPDAPHVVLGQRYTDSISGFRGVATCRTESLYGCVRVCLEGADEKGEPKEFYFDEQRLLTLPEGRPVETTAATGGPRPVVPRTGLR